EGEQQQIAGDNRRQDQRQMHQPVQDRLARKLMPRQHIGDKDADRQADQRRPERDANGQPHRYPLIRAEGEPLHAAQPQSASTVKPCFSKSPAAVSLRRYSMNASASAPAASLSTAAG